MYDSLYVPQRVDGIVHPNHPEVVADEDVATLEVQGRLKGLHPRDARDVVRYHRIGVAQERQRLDEVGLTRRRLRYRIGVLCPDGKPNVVGRFDDRRVGTTVLLHPGFDSGLRPAVDQADQFGARRQGLEQLLVDGPDFARGVPLGHREQHPRDRPIRTRHEAWFVGARRLDGLQEGIALGPCAHALRERLHLDGVYRNGQADRWARCGQVTPNYASIAQ
jgi:hypothetical protein